jgi:hypothetical protein
MVFSQYFILANIEFDWQTAGLILSLVIVPYFLFAIYFAGIPRRRYWGMIFLSVSMLLLNFGVWITTVLSASPLKGNWWIFSFVFSSWYLLCFTLLGVAGLHVFRKKHPQNP